MSSSRARSGAEASLWRATVTATEASDATSRRSRLVSVLLVAVSARSEDRRQATDEPHALVAPTNGRAQGTSCGWLDRVGPQQQT